MSEVAPADIDYPFIRYRLLLIIMDMGLMRLNLSLVVVNPSLKRSSMKMSVILKIG